MPVRRSCPCTRCNGALVSTRTLRRHASRVVNPMAPASSIVSFLDWASLHQSTTRRPPSTRSSDNLELDLVDPARDDDACNVTGDPTDSGHNDYGRPSKRLRLVDSIPSGKSTIPPSNDRIPCTNPLSESPHRLSDCGHRLEQHDEPAIDNSELPGENNDHPAQFKSAMSVAQSAKGKLMVASSTLPSARNLFAVEYLKDHSPTMSEFKVIWDNTSADIKKKYEALSKEKKAAARAT